jgi:hypothetical protein
MLDYFPFVGGEILEQHRTDLKLSQKNDFQDYLSAKK